MTRNIINPMLFLALLFMFCSVTTAFRIPIGRRGVVQDPYLERQPSHYRPRVVKRQIYTANLTTTSEEPSIDGSSLKSSSPGDESHSSPSVHVSSLDAPQSSSIPPPPQPAGGSSAGDAAPASSQASVIPTSSDSHAGSSHLSSHGSSFSKRSSSSSEHASSSDRQHKPQSSSKDILSDIDSAFSGLLSSMSSSRPMQLSPTPSITSTAAPSSTITASSTSKPSSNSDSSKSSAVTSSASSASASSSEKASSTASTSSSDSDGFGLLPGLLGPKSSSTSSTPSSSSSSSSATASSSASESTVAASSATASSSTSASVASSAAQASSGSSESGSAVQPSSAASAAKESSPLSAASGSQTVASSAPVSSVSVSAPAPSVSSAAAGPVSGSTPVSGSVPVSGSQPTPISGSGSTATSAPIGSGSISAGLPSTSQQQQPPASSSSIPSVAGDASTSRRVTAPEITSASSVGLSSLFGTSKLSRTSTPGGVSSASSAPEAPKVASSSAPIAPTTASSTVQPSSPTQAVAQPSSTEAQAFSSSAPVVTPSPKPSTLATKVSSAKHSSAASTSNWLPDGIITEGIPTASSVPSASHTTSASKSQDTGLPSSMPKVITPQGGSPDKPEDTTLIQVGFDYSLNYEFVVNHPLAVSQIFQYLPEGVGYGLDVSSSNVTMTSVRPYQSKSAHYTVSVALAYIPTKYVSTLDSLIHQPTSRLYDNPNKNVASLMNLIDPTIPLIPDGSTSSSGSGSGSGSGSDSGSGGSGGNKNNGGDGDNGNGDNDSSEPGSLDSTPPGSTPKVNTKTVGIAVGAIAGAAAYVGAIFLVAKKYRQKRASLVLENGSSDGDSNVIGGSRFFDDQSINSRSSSGRGGVDGILPIGQQISQPVMSENSLGWT